MIEFEVGPDDDGVDEDLPQPPERHRHGSPRARQRLAIVATVLAAGGIVAYAQLSGPRDGRPAAVGSSASVSSPPLPLPTATSADGGLLVEHLGDRNGTLRNDVEVSVPARLIAPACPQSTDGFASCVVSATVPSDVVNAVDARFPHTGTTSVSTATLRATDAGSRPGLWYRLYRANLSRGGTLTILVTRNDADVDVVPTVFVFGTTTVAYVRHVDPRYRVEVQVRAPTAQAPSLAGLSALAADARLARS